MISRRTVREFIYDHRIDIGAALATLACSLTVFLLSDLRFPNDDQFILFRYIDNIAAGRGFVFNAGEYVLGSTTPLFTLIAALLKFAFPFVTTPTLVACLNMALLSGASVYFVRVAARFLPQNFALLAAAIFALNLSKTIPEGMETPLFILTAFGFLYYLFERRFEVSAVFLALAVLTRPDAGLIAVVAGLYWLHEAGFKKALRLTVISIACALPWLIFATMYFGSFVPQSLVTKLHSSDIYDLPALQATKIQAAHISRIFWGKLFDPENVPLQTAVNLLPVLGLAALGAWRAFSRATWPLFAIPLLYFASFSFSNPIIFPWYLSEMEPFWILASCIGAAYVAQRVKWRPMQWIVLALLIAGPVYGWAVSVVTKDKGTKGAAFEIGQYIRDRAQPGDSVGLADIGIVGYVSGTRIEDFIGLINSEAVGFYPVSAACAVPGSLYTVPPELVMYTSPEWLVSGMGQMSPCLLDSGWFSAHYERVHQSGGAIVWKAR